jgi:cardiolipin synthase
MVGMNLLNWLALGLGILFTCFAAVHALLFKRNPSSALGWIAVCIMFPPIGALLYFIFGINRVRTRARKLENKSPFKIEFSYERSEDEVSYLGSDVDMPHELSEIVTVSDKVSRRPILGGNRIQMLCNGEEAYPSMLDVIETAKKSVFLSTYIFETDRTGMRFIEALTQAARRNLDVRVIIDGIGELYAFPRAGTLLKKRKVNIRRFLPPRLFPPAIHINLRNHRKILFVDGRAAFIGGMNIGDRHLAQNLDNPSRVIDVHFCIEGPVVTQLQEIFLEDWAFCTGEKTIMIPDACFEAGDAMCRTIVDGPNEDLDKLGTILVGAISSARHRVSIVTPYLLPSREIISALQSAALRGVNVEVILPARNNLPFVHWATRNMLWELLQRGVRVFYQPPPFVHSKLFIVDEHYAQIGSANLDPRSLRLNFELVLEIYDKDTARNLADHIKRCREKSKEISLEEMDIRPILIRIRDAVAWLFSPYL